jgi:putative protease
VVEGRAPRHRGVLVAEVLFVGKNSVGVKLKHEIKRGDGVVFDAANWRSPDEPEEGGNVYEVKFATASANVAAASGSKAKSPTSAPSSTSPRNDPSLKNATLSEKAGDKKRVGNIATLEFGHGEIDFERIHVGDLIWRTRDPQLNKRLKTITQTAVPLATQPVEFDVTAAIGKPLEIVARIVMSSDFSEIGTRTAQVGSVDITKDGEMNSDSALLPEASATMQASYCGEQPLSAADKRPLDLETLTDKLGRLGGTPYHLSEIRLLTKDAVFVRTSELNEARRQLVDQLFDTASTVHPIPAKPALQQAIAGLRPSISPSPNLPIPRSHHLPISIHLLVRTPEQLDGAIDAASTQPDAIASITLDYLELYGLRPSVEKIRAAGIRPRVASPRILKPSEQNVIRFLESLECDILIRSGGLLGDFREVKAPAETSDHREVEAPERKNTSPENDIQRIGDFSLNAANALTCRAYLDMGLTRITPTYDLNAEQITDLTKMIPADQLEVIAYSHLPVFHTEHCVFCRFLSDGTDHTNCGHPCEKHRIAVRDHAGRAHPVMADVGCRNTVFGAEAQTDSAATKQWRAAGIANFRLEFVHQTPAQVTAIASAFVGYLNDTLPRNEFDALLKSQSPQKTTTGSLFVPADFKQLVSLN